MKRSLTLTAVAVTAALALAGGTALAFAGERTTPPVRVASTDLTAVQAIDTALKSRPGTVLSADLDLDDDASDRGWEIEILGTDRVTYDVLVDAVTGEVRSVHTDPEDDLTP